MNRRDLENQAEENREVTELLAALPRVEAPANFEFGVKSRIAAGASKQRSTLFPFLKVAIPLSLLLLVGGLVIFYGTIPDNTIIVADTVQQNYAPEQEPVTNTVARVEPGGTSAPRIAQTADNNVITASPRSPKTRTVGRSSNSTSPSESGGGSKDFSLSDANLIQARGTNANKNPEVPVRDLLEMLGMKVDVVGGKWNVLSISPSSVAERSGVFAKDVVESIDDQAISGKDKFRGNSGKTITVGREGKSIKLTLKR